MSTTQHVEARRLLAIIFRAAKSNKLLTYSSAAKALGRNPKTNARMVAQVCDLLDAAAALARVPLLALFVVREKSGDINRRAWAGHELRNAIIEKSKHHRFIQADITAINRALEQLDGMGNRVAWKWVRNNMSRDERYRTMAEPDLSLETDAINDIGADAPRSTVIAAVQYARDPRVRAAVIRRAAGRCELCGSPGFLRDDGSRYLESHHIIALANDGADRTTNVIALCPNDHREAHFGRRQNELEQRMIAKIQKLEARRAD